jgi:hypothetical protein
VELGRVAAVEVLHHGVEAGDFLAGFEEEDVMFSALSRPWRLPAVLVRFLPSMASRSARRSWTKSAGMSLLMNLARRAAFSVGWAVAFCEMSSGCSYSFNSISPGAPGIFMVEWF